MNVFPETNRLIIIIEMDDGNDEVAGIANFHSFQTTHWSVIAAARAGEAAEAREALAALCGAYWYPLYAFVRRKGFDSHSAQDIVQGFLTRLIEKGDLASVDRAKGKFRSFLMAACTHYLANERDHARAKKRGGGQAAVSIDRLAAEGRYGHEPAHELTPERMFERQWAIAVLDRVIDRLNAEMTQAGKSRQFELLKPALLGEARRASFADIASLLGISEDAARAAAHRLRRRYRDMLRNEVALTIDDGANVDEEISALLGALSY